MSRVRAVYTPAILPELRGNPLVEALPRKKDDRSILKSLAVFPECSIEERQLEAFERQEYLMRIDGFRLPLPQYLECFRAIERALIESYSSKNPFSPTTNHYLHYLSPADAPGKPSTGLFEPKGAAMTIVGISGVGKSKMLNQVLSYFPQVIEHVAYHGKDLSLEQLVWVKVDCPPHATLRALCLGILDQIEEILGEPPTGTRNTLDALLVHIERRTRTSFIGIIVIDELQNLDVAKSGGAELVLNFLLGLINRSGVPIVLCGNPEIAKLFKKKFRIARRTEANGYIMMGRMEPMLWQAFAKALWRLQWTNIPTELSGELSEKLYTLSMGIPEFAVRIFKKAQERVIGSANEWLSPEVLEDAFKATCRLTEHGLELIRTEDNSVVREFYADLAEDEPNFVSPKANGELQQQVPDRQSTPEQAVKRARAKCIAGDVTRPQHPEFANLLQQLRTEPFLQDQIGNKRALRQCFEGKDTFKRLHEQKFILNDPLEELL